MKRKLLWALLAVSVAFDLVNAQQESDNYPFGRKNKVNQILTDLSSTTRRMSSPFSRATTQTTIDLTITTTSRPLATSTMPTRSATPTYQTAWTSQSSVDIPNVLSSLPATSPILGQTSTLTVPAPPVPATNTAWRESVMLQPTALVSPKEFNLQPTTQLSTTQTEIPTVSVTGQPFWTVQNLVLIPSAALVALGLITLFVTFRLNSSKQQEPVRTISNFSQYLGNTHTLTFTPRTVFPQLSLQSEFLYPSTSAKTRMLVHVPNSTTTYAGFGDSAFNLTTSNLLPLHMVPTQFPKGVKK